MRLLLTRRSEDDALDRVGTDMENTNSSLRVVDRISDESRASIEKKGASELVMRMWVFTRRLG